MKSTRCWPLSARAVDRVVGLWRGDTRTGEWWTVTWRGTSGKPDRSQFKMWLMLSGRSDGLQRFPLFVATMLVIRASRYAFLLNCTDCTVHREFVDDVGTFLPTKCAHRFRGFAKGGEIHLRELHRNNHPLQHECPYISDVPRSNTTRSQSIITMELAFSPIISHEEGLAT